MVAKKFKEEKGDEDGEPRKQSREEWKKQRELEEMRKAGTAPAMQDEEGKYVVSFTDFLFDITSLLALVPLYKHSSFLLLHNFHLFSVVIFIILFIHTISIITLQFALSQNSLYFQHHIACTLNIHFQYICSPFFYYNIVYNLHFHCHITNIINVQLCFTHTYTVCLIVIKLNVQHQVWTSFWRKVN